MNARDAILSRVKKALAVGTDDGQRRDAVRERLAISPRGIIPARGQLPDAERVALFAAMAEKASASIARIADIDDLPGEVVHYLKSKNLPASVLMGDDPLLAEADWSKERQLDIRKGASDGADLVGLSHAFAAVAETGTLVLAS
jgi:L-lactate dehydrogenase complex protein LldG